MVSAVPRSAGLVTMGWGSLRKARRSNEPVGASGRSPRPPRIWRARASGSGGRVAEPDRLPARCDTVMRYGCPLDSTSITQVTEPVKPGAGAGIAAPGTATV